MADVGLSAADASVRLARFAPYLAIRFRRTRHAAADRGYSTVSDEELFRLLALLEQGESQAG